MSTGQGIGGQRRRRGGACLRDDVVEDIGYGGNVRRRLSRLRFSDLSSARHASAEARREEEEDGKKGKGGA